MKRRSACGAVSLALLLGCGTAREPSIPMGQFIESPAGSVKKSWESFGPGARVAVAPNTGCPELVASGAPLSADTWKSESVTYTVLDATVTQGPSALLSLSLLGDAGDVGVVQLPASSEPTCVTPAGESESSTLATLLNKPLRFHPEAASCTQIEAIGASLDSTLLANSSDPITFKSITAAPASADAVTGMMVPWAVADGVELRVRADVVATCFTESQGVSPSDVAPETTKRRMTLSSNVAGPDLLHIDRRRCKAEETPTGEHLRCSTPVGVWRGQRTGDVASLELRRRNLGPIHFVNGRRVDAKAYAETVVAVKTASSTDPAADRLYAGIRSATEATLSSDESTRVAARDDEANLSIVVEVSGIEVSDKTTRSEQFVHEYQDGTRREENPEKPKAQQKVRVAEANVENARSECAERKVEAQRNYNTCMAAAKAASNLANGKTERTMEAVGTLGCTVYQIAASGNCSEVRDAISALESARSAEIETPATVEIPIKKRATVTRTTFARHVNAGVRVTTKLNGVDQPPAATSFSADLTDYHVERDERIKLSGHPARAAWLDDPKAAVPAVADKMAEWVSTTVRAMLSRARLERAKQTLKKSGDEIDEGFEALGGMALDIADTRLTQMIHAGSLTLKAGKPAVLPRPKLGKNECLLVVAALPEGEAGKLSITTADGNVADTRKRPYAAIEVCGDDLVRASDDLPNVKIQSDEDAPTVQWAQFRAKSGGAANDTTSGARTPPAAVVAEKQAYYPRPAAVEALSVFGRASAGTWLLGSTGSDSIGDVFTSSPALAVGGGVRVGTGWLAYGEWEHAYGGVGEKSPVFGLREVSASGDLFLLGGRKTFLGWAVGNRGFRTLIAPLVDLAVGYSVLRQNGTDVDGNSRVFRLPAPAMRVMSGVSLRPSRWYSIDPTVALNLAWLEQVEAEQTIGGETRGATRRFEESSIRLGVSIGIAGVFDLPFGDPSPPAAKKTARGGR